LTERGREAFLREGCGACHRIQGTGAVGRVGPDLTHLASRATLGAGTLAMGVENLRRWISHTDAIKPEVLMPSYPMLDEATVVAIAAYLASLR
jgi:cytochrome c oxidase subunit 2